MCNGPSLLETDFDLLHRSGVFTLGLNKVNLLFDRTSLRPSALVAVNSYVIDQNAAFYNDTEIPLSLDRYSLRFETRRRTIPSLHSATLRKFPRHCRIGIQQSHTLTFLALQHATNRAFNT